MTASPFKSERSIWVISPLPQSQDVFAPFISALAERYPRVDLATTFQLPQGSDLAELARPVARPSDSPRAWEKAFRVMDTRVVIFIGALARADEGLLAAARQRAAPVILVDPALFGLGDKLVTRGGVPVAKGPYDRAYVASLEARTALLEAGYGNAQCVVVEAGEAAQGDDFLANAIREDMRRDQKIARSGGSSWRRVLADGLVQSFEEGILSRIFGSRIRHYRTLAELRSGLGEPETILCLGNGPSSADPALGGVEYDCLFRVNHMWMDKGFLTKADMVFTGGSGTIKRVGGSTFGLLSRQSLGRLMLSLMVASLIRRLGFTTLDDLGVFLREGEWQDIRPTNGAAMLAVASALQPKRLVISGVDLFSHPAGAYPGDPNTPNAYTPGHDADSELAILLEALSRYKGELVILSDALAKEWQGHRDRTLQENA